MIIQSIQYKKSNTRNSKEKPIDFCMETMAHKVTVPSRNIQLFKIMVDESYTDRRHEIQKVFNERGLQ